MADKTLDNFNEEEPVVTVVPTVVPVLKKPRKPRKTRAELNLEWRNELIIKEHKLDGTSKTINLERCFLTKLRVSKEVWEEIRAQTIDLLDLQATRAEERALKGGRATIMLEDII